jgi:hypothetical protein
VTFVKFSLIDEKVADAAGLEDKITPPTTEIYIADFSQAKELILLFIRVIDLFLRNMGLKPLFLRRLYIGLELLRGKEVWLPPSSFGVKLARAFVFRVNFSCSSPYLIINNANVWGGNTKY